jgi:cob(I)alamin adenosyltransferase
VRCGVPLERGYVQVYTGDGKGKTTAALGLSLRAAGAGLRVVIVQFAKSGGSAEHEALKRFGDLVTVHACGTGAPVAEAPSPEDMKCAARGMELAREAVASGRCDVLVMDEACFAASRGLVAVEDLVSLARTKPERMELVITGRGAPAALVELADLVTEMRCVRHYHDRGVVARKGVER